MLATKNGAVDLKVEEEGRQEEQCNRGCAWLRMKEKNKVERQETEEKIKIQFQFQKQGHLHNTTLLEEALNYFPQVV